MSMPLFDQPTVNDLRDHAIAQVAEHAEQHHPTFGEQARDFVLAYLRAHGPSSGEVLTEACKASGVKPHDDRAFGTVYMTLARWGRIQKVGTVRRERGHGTAGGNIWDLTASVR